MAQQHEIFSVTEILEAILLETDMRTVLVSAQRVCRNWRRLIQKSGDLQAHLFFRPIEPHIQTERQRNPLLNDHLWSRFYRQQLPSLRRHSYYRTLKLPFLDAVQESAFLREEASWRNMLLQQPPTSRVGLIERSTCTESPNFTEAVITPKDDDHIRMRHLDRGLLLEVLMPGQDKWLFWAGSGALILRKSEREMREEREIAVSNYLKECDFVVVVSTCRWLFNKSYVCSVEPGVPHWARGLGEWRIVEGRSQVPIFTY